MAQRVDEIPIQGVVLRSVHFEVGIAITTGVEQLYPVIVSNLSFGSGCRGRSSSQAHLPKRARFRARAHSSVSGQLYEMIGGADQPRSLSCRLSAADVGFVGILYPPGTWAFVTSGLPSTTNGIADPDGVSVFRTHEIRLGGVPLIPRNSGIHTAAPTKVCLSRLGSLTEQ